MPAPKAPEAFFFFFLQLEGFRREFLWKVATFFKSWHIVCLGCRHPCVSSFFIKMKFSHNFFFKREKKKRQLNKFYSRMYAKSRNAKELSWEPIINPQKYQNVHNTRCLNVMYDGSDSEGSAREEEEADAVDDASQEGL
jgi:hypothetical protein